MAEATVPGPGDGAPQFRRDTCRCGASMVWAVIPGRGDPSEWDRIPVDADPVPVSGGNATVLLTPHPDGTPRARVVKHAGELFGRTEAYRRHIETCTHADYYRHRAQMRRMRGQR